MIEIKSSQTYNSRFVENLDWLEKNLSVGKVKKIVVYDGAQEWKNEQQIIINFRIFLNEI